jgi:hypothetical protein
VRSPRFTGESAVYATTGHYRTSWLPGDGEPSLWVALSVPGKRGRDCIPGCICVTPEGCPCCDVIATRRPTMMRESSTTLTCQPGSESTCQDWCDHAGGGMSSNPDGSTSCTVYTQV